jgi:hypothetical protein
VTNFPPEEKERLEALQADADFWEANTRRDHLAVAAKDLRRFAGDHCMSFEAIGCFFGVNAAVISEQMRLAG